MVTEFRGRETRQQRFDRMDDDLDYDAADLDRRVVASDQIRTVIATLRDSLPAMFGDRIALENGRLKHIPKTLIFAKDHSRADDTVRIVREEFGLPNMGAVKITYRSGDSGHKPEDLLRQFRTGYDTRIAVTVDMIATGTDVRPIECVVFMPTVRSRNFYEQMKGRGVRTIDGSDLRIVTPDATAEDHFVIVDAVGVTEADLNDTAPLERNHNIGFDELLNLIGLGSTDDEAVSSVASRLARLDKRITQPDRAEIETVAGVSLAGLAARLADRGGLTYADVRELADAIRRPPRQWTPETLWAAYETLDASKVRSPGHRVNTDLVSLVRYAPGNADELVAYPDLVNERLDTWMHPDSRRSPNRSGSSLLSRNTSLSSMLPRRLWTRFGRRSRPSGDRYRPRRSRAGSSPRIPMMSRPQRCSRASPPSARRARPEGRSPHDD